MGYSFLLKMQILLVIVEGNIYTFLDQTLSSATFYQPNIEFLHRLIVRTEEDFSLRILLDIIQDLMALRDEWKDERIFEQSRNGNSDSDNGKTKRLLNYLYKVSKLLSDVNKDISNTRLKQRFNK